MCLEVGREWVLVAWKRRGDLDGIVDGVMGQCLACEIIRGNGKLNRLFGQCEAGGRESGLWGIGGWGGYNC